MPTNVLGTKELINLKYNDNWCYFSKEFNLSNKTTKGEKLSNLLGNFYNEEDDNDKKIYPYYVAYKSDFYFNNKPSKNTIVELFEVSKTNYMVKSSWGIPDTSYELYFTKDKVNICVGFDAKKTSFSIKSFFKIFEQLQVIEFNLLPPFIAGSKKACEDYIQKYHKDTFVFLSAKDGIDYGINFFNLVAEIDGEAHVIVIPNKDFFPSLFFSNKTAEEMDTEIIGNACIIKPRDKTNSFDVNILCPQLYNTNEYLFEILLKVTDCINFDESSLSVDRQSSDFFFKVTKEYIKLLDPSNSNNLFARNYIKKLTDPILARVEETEKELALKNKKITDLNNELAITNAKLDEQKNEKKTDDEYEEYIKDLEKQINTLKDDLEREKAKTENFKTQFENSGSTLSSLTFNSINEKEFYYGEIHDLIISILKDKYEISKQYGKARRSIDLLKAFLDTNFISKGRTVFEDMIKKAAVDASENIVKNKGSLIRAGFDVEIGNHHKITYNNDQRYKIILSSTPSCSSSKKNVKHEIITKILY